MSKRAPRLMPGFALSAGITLTLLCVVVLLPALALVAKLAGSSFDQLIDAAFTRRALAAYRLSIGTSLAAAVASTLLGLLVSWVLVRYDFVGRRWLDALVDLPFALPTAVAGIALTALWGPNGPLGAPLAALGIHVAYTPLGISLALVFIGLPFVVRTLQPVIEEIEPEVEEAAAALGAGRGRTFVSVLLPTLAPALGTGFALAFARGMGEYGSVIFIAGNMPMQTEIAPLLIVTRLEEFDYVGAAAIAAVLLLMSGALLVVINAATARMQQSRSDT